MYNIFYILSKVYLLGIIEVLRISTNTHHLLNPIHDEELNELSLSKGRYSNWQDIGVLAFAIATIFTLGIATTFFIVTAYFKHKEVLEKLNKTSEEKISNTATNIILENQKNKLQTVTQPIVIENQENKPQTITQSVVISENQSQSSSDQSSLSPVQSDNSMSQDPIALQQIITINNIEINSAQLAKRYNDFAEIYLNENPNMKTTWDLCPLKNAVTGVYLIHSWANETAEYLRKALNLQKDQCVIQPKMSAGGRVVYEVIVLKKSFDQALDKIERYNKFSKKAELNTKWELGEGVAVTQAYKTEGLLSDEEIAKAMSYQFWWGLGLKEEQVPTVQSSTGGKRVMIQQEIFDQALIRRKQVSHQVINNINNYNLTQETFLKEKATEWKNLGLKARFNELSKISKQLDPTNEAVKRFPDVDCPRDTSIKVKDQVLHANSTQLNNQLFICTQAPLKNTEELFWKAAMKHQTQLILDLTTNKDIISGGVHPYYPKNINDSYTTNTITINFVDQIRLDGNPLILNKYEVEVKDGIKKEIYRLHFPNWPDHGALDAEEFSTLIQAFTEYRNFVKENCPMIHCRAGVGRTGSFSVATALVDMIKKGEITAENYSMTIDTLVLAGRYQRGTSFVQNENQYISLHLLAKKMLNLS